MMFASFFMYICIILSHSSSMFAVSAFEPSPEPSPEPTVEPTPEPSILPTPLPSTTPSRAPTSRPSIQPTFAPTPLPSIFPTQLPSTVVTQPPSYRPSTMPTPFPTRKPTAPTASPSQIPTVEPTPYPSSLPTAPTHFPTLQYSYISGYLSKNTYTSTLPNCYGNPVRVDFTPLGYCLGSKTLTATVYDWLSTIVINTTSYYDTSCTRPASVTQTIYQSSCTDVITYSVVNASITGNLPVGKYIRQSYFSSMGNCINGATPNSVTMVATNESQLVTSPSAYYASYSCSGSQYSFTTTDVGEGSVPPETFGPFPLKTCSYQSGFYMTQTCTTVGKSYAPSAAPTGPSVVPTRTPTRPSKANANYFMTTWDSPTCTGNVIKTTTNPIDVCVYSNGVYSVTMLTALSSTAFVIVTTRYSDPACTVYIQVYYQTVSTQCVNSAQYSWNYNPTLFPTPSPTLVPTQPTAEPSPAPSTPSPTPLPAWEFPSFIAIAVAFLAVVFYAYYRCFNIVAVLKRKNILERKKLIRERRRKNPGYVPDNLPPVKVFFGDICFFFCSCRPTPTYVPTFVLPPPRPPKVPPSTSTAVTKKRASGESTSTKRSSKGDGGGGVDGGKLSPTRKRMEERDDMPEWSSKGLEDIMKALQSDEEAVFAPADEYDDNVETESEKTRWYSWIMDVGMTKSGTGLEDDDDYDPNAIRSPAELLHPQAWVNALQACDPQCTLPPVPEIKFPETSDPNFLQRLRATFRIRGRSMSSASNLADDETSDPRAKYANNKSLSFQARMDAFLRTNSFTEKVNAIKKQYVDADADAEAGDDNFEEYWADSHDQEELVGSGDKVVTVTAGEATSGPRARYTSNSASFHERMDAFARSNSFHDKVSGYTNVSTGVGGGGPTGVLGGSVSEEKNVLVELPKIHGEEKWLHSHPLSLGIRGLTSPAKK